MTEQAFAHYARQFGALQTRSMFGGIGWFQSDAMFALIAHDRIFIRGGGKLDAILHQLGCEKYRHVKKQTTATVNYYDVTALFEANNAQLKAVIRDSIAYSIQQRQQQKSADNRRLRDLPNMHLTLERMVKKAGIDSVETFIRLGAAEVFARVRQIYGEIDITLLWKFAGAIDGIQWQLLQEPKKQQLLDCCQLNQ